MAVNGGDVRATLVLNIKRWLQGIRNATNATEEMESSIEESMEGIGESAESAFEGINKSGAVFGAGLAGAGAIVGTALLDMTTGFKDTQKSLNSFGAQTGITGKELDTFKGKIEATYLKGYGEDIQEVSDTYSKFQRELKLSANETEVLTEKAFDLRDVFNYELDDSLRASTSLIKQFGIDGTDAYDLIAKGAQLSGDRADDLLDTVNEYSKDFVKAGYGADEMFNLLIAGINNGIMDFDKIGDSVKEFGNVLLQSGDEGIEILTELTGSEKEAKKFMDDLANGTLSTKDAMGKVVGELAEMDDKVLQNQIGASLFGSLWEEAGIKGLDAMVNADNATKDYKGTLDEATKTLKGNNVTMEVVSRQFEQLKNLIGQQLAPILQKALIYASAFLLGLLQFAQANPVLTKIVAIGSLVFAVLGTITGAIIAIGAILPTITAGFTFLGTVLGGIGTVIATVAGAFFSLPVLIGIAVAALIALIVLNWDKIKKVTKDLWNYIVKKWNEQSDKVRNLLIALVATAITKWNEMKTRVRNIISSMWNFIYSLYDKGIRQNIIKLATMVTAIRNKFDSARRGAIEKVRSMFNKVVQYFSRLPGKIASYGSKVYSKAKYLGQRMIDGIKNKLNNLPKTIKDAVTNAINGVGKLGSTAYTALKNIGSSMWNGFKKGLGINSPSYLEEAMFNISDEGENMRKNLYNTFRRMDKLPQINSLSNLTKRQKELSSTNDNRLTQNFNSPLVQILGGNNTEGLRTANSLYDLITFNKRAMGVNT